MMQSDFNNQVDQDDFFKAGLLKNRGTLKAVKDQVSVSDTQSINQPSEKIQDTVIPQNLNIGTSPRNPPESKATAYSTDYDNLKLPFNNLITKNDQSISFGEKTKNQENTTQNKSSAGTSPAVLNFGSFNNKQF